MPNMNAAIKARQAALLTAPPVTPADAPAAVIPAAAGDTIDKSVLYVTEKHLEWKRRPSREQVPTEAALEFALMVLRGEDYVPRAPGEKRFTASRIGDDCDRRVLLSYINAPKDPVPIKSLDRMDQGSMLHLAWQIEGLSAGYLTEAEQWRQHDVVELGVKYDGRLADDMGLAEFKFTNANKYRKTIRGDRDTGKPPGPWDDHRLQCETAMWLFDEAWMSLVYVNTDDGDFTEYRLRRSERWQAELDAKMNHFYGFVEADTLPEMHPTCERDRQSWRYLGCQYRGICPDAGKVSLSEWTSTASTSGGDG